MKSNELKLIPYIMRFNRMTQEEAEAWADKHCGDWRNTTIPKAKRIKSVATNEEE